MLKKFIINLLTKLHYGRYCRKVANGQRISLSQLQAYPRSTSGCTHDSENDVVFVPISLNDIDVLDEALEEYKADLKPEHRWQEGTVKKLLNKFNSQRESLLL